MMRVAGIDRFGGAVMPLRLAALPEPGPDEVLFDVRAAGVGNWDDIVRTGGWDVGQEPPLALGVEAAGVVAAVGSAVRTVTVGERVCAHSAPLRAQGAWAERFLVGEIDVATLPASVEFDVGAGFAVPALTADDVLRDALRLAAGQSLLVHGAGGVTGGLLVALARHDGARVIATAGSASARRVAELGAEHVLPYSDPGWPDTARALAGGDGVEVAANCIRGDADRAITAVRDGGRLATITSDPPGETRDIAVTEVYVAPDGPRLGELLRLLEAGTLVVEVGARYPLDQAAEALAHVRRGTHGTAIVVRP